MQLNEDRSGLNEPIGSATTGMVRLLLQSEGLAAVAASLVAYDALDASWWLLASLVLLPDVFAVGYLVNRRIGATIYNVGHTYLAPGALAAAGQMLGYQDFLPIALIWCAHIGFDRMMGYGLKYPRHFKATHLSSAVR